MRLYSLPPTGNAIATSNLAAPPPNTVEFQYPCCWVGSGTQALVVSLLEVKKQNPDVLNPEVIVPAYCCPDLLSAARFAGFEPVIADVQTNSPKLCLKGLFSLVTENTLAVVAINFLGIKEDIPGIRQVLSGRPIAIIEDNAQWFPESAGEFQLSGDFATFSFGRGKALSLLGGGLVLSRTPIVVDFATSAESANAKWRVKVQLMSWLSSPRIYPLLEAAPFLALGETRYHVLESMECLPQSKLALLPANWARYSERPRTVEGVYRSQLTQNLMHSDLTTSSDRLLRYPFLFETSDQRDQFYRLARKEGLGVSLLYQTSLPNVEGVAEAGFSLSSKQAEQAQQLAERFVTLPTHERVPLKKAERIVELIQQVTAK